MTIAATSIQLRVEAPPIPPAEVILGPPAPRTRGDVRTSPRPVDVLRPAGPRRQHSQLEARSRRLVQALVEIVDGDRPVGQILRMATDVVYDDLVARLASLGAATARGARVGPLSTRVASVHVEQPRRDCAEVSARIVQGSRSRALALRLDLVDGRWLCSALRWG